MSALLPHIEAPTSPSALLVAGIVLSVCLPWPGFQVGGSTFSVADLASFALVGMIGIQLLAGRHTLPLPAALVFVAVASGAVASTLVATDVTAALPGLVRYLQLFVLVPVAVLLSLRDRGDIVVVLAAVLGAGTLQGIVGTVQYVTGTGASIGGETVRAVGTFGPQEIMAMSTMVSFALLVALAGAVAPGTRRMRATLVVAAVALSAPLAFSFSRGSWLATGVAALVVLAWLGWKRLLQVTVLLVAIATVLVGGFGLGAGMIGERLGSLTSSVSSPDSSVGDRYHLWGTAVSIWEQHPVVGGGMRSFPALRDAHAPLGLSSASDTDQPGVGFVRQELLSPHNQYLLVLSEQGLLGATALVGLLIAPVIATTRRLVRAREPAEIATGLAVLGLCAWQVVQFLYADTGGSTSVVGAVVLGLGAAYGFAARPAASATPSTAGSATPVGPPIHPATPVRPPGARTDRPATSRPAPERSSESRMILTATVISTALIGLGSVGGVARDLLLASYFGADGTTDAFLVAWTIAESAVPLLIDGAMALLLVPAFTRALTTPPEPFLGSGSAAPREAVRSLVGFMLPRLLVGLAVTGAIVFATAPWLVRILAPGLAVPELGVQAMRIVAGSLLLLGLAGFAAGALRAHLVFGPPAAISVAFNTGIIGSIVLLHERLGILSAAVGVTVGAGLMLLVQLPAYLRRVPLPRQIVLRTALIGSGAFLPIAVYTLSRQAQVYVERFVGSTLEPGTISHLNYAQKIGQLPSSLALILAVVTFPLLARSLTSGAESAARRRMEADVRIVGGVVLLSTVFLLVFAPRVVELLFERGAFVAADTAATAAILRIYVFGLLGQALVELFCRALFTGRSTYFPAAMMGAGLAVTAAVAALGAVWWGAPGIAAGNAAGITVTAVGLLFARRSRAQAVHPRAIGSILGRLVPAVTATAVVGLVVSWLTTPSHSLAAVAVGGGAMVLTFVATATTTGGLPPLRHFLGKEPAP
ncbi:lipid II flippase MurJ [Pseudonocardia sp. NPDC049635]|uniref:lipid II flippase MurJ n=1 Tax=Pseudonocardia sp. NPDC049635 TaxID=3155506 RepID=UPI0033E3C5B8